MQNVTFCPSILFRITWWRYQMGTFSALLATCAGNSPVTGEFHAQRPVTRSFNVFFDLRLNKRWSKQSWVRWFETPSSSLWRHCNGCTSYTLLNEQFGWVSNWQLLLDIPILMHYPKFCDQRLSRNSQTRSDIGNEKVLVTQCSRDFQGPHALRRCHWKQVDSGHE